MALQDNDGGGSSSGDLESLRGKPSMFLIFYFLVKDQLFIANCLILFTEIQFLLLMWLQILVNWLSGNASK